LLMQPLSCSRPSASQAWPFHARGTPLSSQRVRYRSARTASSISAVTFCYFSEDDLEVYLDVLDGGG